jgi:WD40 repeat protein
MVVVDQFEELITQCMDAGERAAFLAAVAGLVGEAGDRIRVVVTVRTDFEGQFRDSPLGAVWRAARFPVLPLTQDDYREVITAPAAHRAIFFDPAGLVEKLINDVVQMPGGLPLLSFTLSEMYLSYLKRSGDDRCLTWADYEAVGGVVVSLRNRVERLYKEELATDAERETLKRVMLRMVSVEGGALARRRVPVVELVYESEEENRRVSGVLERLTAARLVVPDQDADGQTVVEPAHDALVNGWDRLLRWTREEQEQLALRRLLTPAAADWKAGTGGLWWANPRLPVLVRLADSETAWLNKDEREFVRRSEAKRRRTRRWVVGTTTAAFIVLSGLMLYSFSLWRTSEGRLRTANSRRLASLSASERRNHLDRSLLLAAKACELDNTFEARDSLLSALQAQPFLNSFLHCDDVDVKCLSFSPDGNTLAVGCGLYGEAGRGSGFGGGRFGGSVLLFDVVSRSRLDNTPLPVAEGGVTSVAFSHDGKTLAASYSGGVNSCGVVLWDVARLSRLNGSPLTVSAMEIRAVTFSPNGKTLAAGYDDTKGGSVGLWNVGKMRVTCSPLRVDEGMVHALAFCPDGKTLAAGYHVGRFGDGIKHNRGGVVVWDVRGRNRIRNSSFVVPQGNVTAVAFNPDGSILATGYYSESKDSSGGVVAWDMTNRKLLDGSPLAAMKCGTSSMAFSPDGAALAIGCTRPVFDKGQDSLLGGLILCDLKAGWRSAAPVIVAEVDVKCVAFAPDGKALAASHSVGFYDGGVVLWETAGRGCLAGSPLVMSKDDVATVTFSPDGKTLATGSREEGVALWNVVERSRVPGTPFPVAEGETSAVSFNLDGNTIIAGYGSPAHQGGVVLWNRAKRIRIGGSPLAVTEGNVTGVKVSPDGKTLAAGYADGHRGGVVLWDLPGCQRLNGSPLVMVEGQVSTIAFSPGGKTLAANFGDLAHPGGVVLWNVAEYARLGGSPFAMPEGDTHTLAFSTDGKTLAAGYVAFPAGGVVLWDVARRTRLAGAPVINGNVVSLDFSHDGKTLAAGCIGSGMDNSGGGVVLWDVAAQTRFAAPFTMPKTIVNSVVFSPDSKTMAASYGFVERGRTGETILWDIDRDSWIRKARKIANRDFTPEENRLFSLTDP